MNLSAKIFIAGKNGMVGRAIEKQLFDMRYTNVIGPSSGELNLIDAVKVKEFFEKERPEYVFLCAAKVGGIYANMTYKADFMYLNLLIEANVIHNASIFGVKKIVFISSGCIYPRDAQNPISEDALFTGKLEPSNEHYAVAKIAGIKLCESYHDQYGLSYAVAVPNNIYGPNDNFDLKNSHVMAALLRRFHEARIDNIPSIAIWGSGKQRREFIYVSDLASACITLMEKTDFNGTANIGFGSDVSIAELSEIIKQVTGFKGLIEFDITKPEGFPRKYFNSSIMRSLGWEPKTPLQEGVKLAYNWLVQNGVNRISS